MLAIECYHEPIPNPTRRVFGRMCLWVRGDRFGDINESGCMLNVTEGHLLSLLQEIDSLDHPVLNNLNDRDAFEFLDRALYLDDERSNEQITIDARMFSKFDFLTNAGESFDHTKSFIISRKDDVRLLLETDGNVFSSAAVPRATFTGVVKEFLAWISNANL